jgi:hypothetical protein
MPTTSSTAAPSQAEALLLEMRRLGPRPDAALLEGLLARAQLRLLLQMPNSTIRRRRAEPVHLHAPARRVRSGGTPRGLMVGPRRR